jgi:hypothetical protein
VTWREEIQKHYESVWRNSAVVCAFSQGPIHELPADFAVLKFRPTPDRTMWTYATCCMSAPYDSPAIELHIFSGNETDEIVEVLFAVAHYHRNAAHLGLNDTVNFGRGWQKNSKCDHGFISLPYLDGPALENLSAQTKIITYWLIPVTKAEVDYKKQFGPEALEKHFDTGLNYLSPSRPSIV